MDCYEHTLIKDNRHNHPNGVLSVIKPRKSYGIKVYREFDSVLTRTPIAATTVPCMTAER